MKVGFIGLGQMGAGMATSLIRAGHELTVYNRTREKAQPLAALGAKVAERIADACRGEVVFTMLADDRAVEGVTLGSEGIERHLARGAIHISSSTISVRLAEKLTEVHAKAGQAFVSVPVFGRPPVAATGKLFVVAAGDNSVVERIAPLLGSIGQKVCVLSERPRDANLLKLSGNFLITAMIEALGEMLALVEKGGLDRRVCMDFLTSTLFDAPIYKNYGGMMVERAVYSRRLCGASRAEGCPSRVGRGRGSRRSIAAGESGQRSVPAAHRSRRRAARLGGHRRPAGGGCRNRLTPRSRCDPTLIVGRPWCILCGVCDASAGNFV
jgi:3-hydroxyisobutyrate dehydrogenase-like beta-hydroxyacid dehydrogenase